MLESDQMMKEPHLFLASGSPRRSFLLSAAGFPFRVGWKAVDESPFPLEQPLDYVLRMAEMKARAAQDQAGSGELILAADTTVADGELILGKPADAQEAERMLLRLRGRFHAVHTAIALYNPGEGWVATDLCSTRVPMRAYSPEEVRHYVASGDPLDKAGAYAIQHPVFQPVESLTGCYASVMGLPLCHVVRLLERQGYCAPENVPQACQAALQYQCPVFAAVLRGENVG